MSDRQITVGPPVRETPGFGCAGCGKPLSLDAVVLRRTAATGRMSCCGQWLESAEVVRLLRAADALEVS
jgi:hypothetical protein